MSFSFNATAGTSQNTAKPRLEGNEIYTVKFDSCEKEDIKGVKDPDKTYKVIKMTFSNEDGYYEHTVFEPRPEDFTRGETEFKNKQGNIEKIPQPSNVETMMMLFKHVIDSVVPEVAKQIDSGEKQLTAPTWDSLRDLIIKILSYGKGREVKIKLIKNNKNEAKFPGFFTGLTREGKVYVRNNFIGEKIAFTAYEIGKINAAATATPTNTANYSSGSTGVPENSGIDFDFDVNEVEL